MSVLTGQLGTTSSYPGNMILGVQGCTADFFDGQLGTIDDYCGNMILAVANFCQPAPTPTSTAIERAVNNTITFSNTATRLAVFVRSASNTIHFTQTTVRGHVAPRNASNTIVFGEDAEHVKIGIASNTIIFTNTATAQGPFKAAKNTLNLVQTLVRLFIFDRHFTSIFDVVDVADANYIKNLFIGRRQCNIYLTSTIGNYNSYCGRMVLGAEDFCVPVTDVVDKQADFSLSQVASKYTILAEKQINQHFQINQNAEKFKQASVSSTITFTARLSFRRLRNQSIQNNIIFNQAVIKAAILKRSISQIWNVHNGYQLTVPGIGVIENIPGAIGIITNCFVLLESIDRSIVLPCPRFDDSQEWSSLRVLLKRSILGDTRTYVGRSGLSKIKYTFWLGRQKSLELRQFLLDFIDDDLIMTNFKGEVWLVKFANATNDLIPKMRYDPQRERVDVVLEFEGSKLY